MIRLRNTFILRLYQSIYSRADVHEKPDFPSTSCGRAQRRNVNPGLRRNHMYPQYRRRRRIAKADPLDEELRSVHGREDDRGPRIYACSRANQAWMDQIMAEPESTSALVLRPLTSLMSEIIDTPGRFVAEIRRHLE
jgi:hypothetical protein